MRVLLSDGSGLTARQAAAQLADGGHLVEALSADPLSLARFTRQVHRIHRVPLGAAQHTGRLRPVLAEVLAAVWRTGDYRGSAEELTPIRGDLRSATPLALALGALMIQPSAWQRFVGGSVRHYSLTPAGWRALLDRQPPL